MEDVNLNIKLSCPILNVNYDTKIRNKCTGFDIKYKFTKLNGLDSRLYKVRVFYGGQEILDTHCLFYHNIKDGDTLHILVNERGITVDTYSKIRTKKTARRIKLIDEYKKDNEENEKNFLLKNESGAEIKDGNKEDKEDSEEDNEEEGENDEENEEIT